MICFLRLALLSRSISSALSLLWLLRISSSVAGFRKTSIRASRQELAE